MSSKIIFLKVTSWAGMSIGAIHYYGKLISYENKVLLAGRFDPVTVEHKATRQEAIDHNKWNRQMAREFAKVITPGDLIDWFLDEGSLRIAAVECFKRNFKKSVLLIEEANGNIDPNPVLFGPDKMMQRLNGLNQKAEKIGRWDNDLNDKEMRKICDEWDKIIKDLK